MKLDYLNTTTCEWQNHNLVSNKVISIKLVSQGCICITSNVINNKTYNELSQTVRLTVQVFKNHHDCNPFQSFSHHDFVLFYVPFLPPFNVLSSYFCFTQLKVVISQFIYDKFRDRAQSFINKWNSQALVASRLRKMNICYFIQ